MKFDRLIKLCRSITANLGLSQFTQFNSTVFTKQLQTILLFWKKLKWLEPNIVWDKLRHLKMLFGDLFRTWTTADGGAHCLWFCFRRSVARQSKLPAFVRWFWSKEIANWKFHYKLIKSNEFCFIIYKQKRCKLLQQSRFLSRTPKQFSDEINSRRDSVNENALKISGNKFSNQNFYYEKQFGPNLPRIYDPIVFTWRRSLIVEWKYLESINAAIKIWKLSLKWLSTFHSSSRL